MDMQKLSYIFLLCILEVLGRSIFDTTLHSNKYLISETGFDLNPEQKIKHKIWDKGIVPYYIDTLSYDKPLRDDIRTKLHETGDMTGISFQELDGPPKDKSKTRWVMFINRINKLECDEHTVTGEGVQRINLGYDCLAKGVAVPKAVLAILSIPPQHNSPDRDEYIVIKEYNILPDKTEYFDKLEDQDWLFHDIEYDFFSIGHYTYFQYTANGAYTISPKNYTRYNLLAGEGTTYSEYDIWKIAMLYNYIISKSKLPSVHCDKLFKAGTNYSNIEPDRTALQHASKPRKIPNKYLGLQPEIGPQNSANDIENEKEYVYETVEEDDTRKNVRIRVNERKKLVDLNVASKEINKTSLRSKPTVEPIYDDSMFDV